MAADFFFIYYVMSPFLIIGLVAAGVLAFSLGKTAKAGLNISCNIKRFGIYKLVDNANLVLRVVIRITNPTSTPLHFQSLDFSAYVGSKTVTQNGNLVVKEKGTLLANAQLNKAFVINPNGSTEATLYVNCPWLNIGKYLGLSILNLLTNNQRLSELARQIYNEPFLLSGYIRAENITIPFNFIQKINASDSEVTV